MKKYLTFLALCGLLFSTPVLGQTDSVTEGLGALDSNQLALLIIIGVVIGVIVLLLILIIYLMSFISAVFRKENPELADEPSWWDSFKERFVTGDIEEEQSSGKLMEDHSYDGIQELDNFMPPWLQYVFSGTIIIAVVYFGYYTVLGFGMTGIEEYEEEIRIAAVEAEARGVSSLASIDETNVELDNSAAAISTGKTIYDSNCAACHAADLGGGIGPNLTDQYWLHGGDIKDVFTVVKYGVIAKGMVPWEDQLSPTEIQDVSSYILSMQGTTPAVAKEAQGELYTGKSEAAPSVESVEPADSTAVTKVIAE
ncbi:cytochrome c oxidase cbb3-type subunit 3 [Algoriphagus ratkowskyi]|uniref:C-type cytochrome n=1 Tax=Algoriphagus ratkowskyi TaxID=57028 RepID=A0A2W7QR87_9BACT|nr:cbb3-type cytochrome c oxidase N-terminal domain-containing protein [Algoriphagus ratkowskyi]PZX51053.1 cytochrome c oxidase cbb3-type subunit 3 [Algoriphagus ratkowskyi]TXD75843.1 c-type cytochrome [Algoriphagus ratkowskyi]